MHVKLVQDLRTLKRQSCSSSTRDHLQRGSTTFDCIAVSAHWSAVMDVATLLNDMMLLLLLPLLLMVITAEPMQPGVISHVPPTAVEHLWISKMRFFLLPRTLLAQMRIAECYEGGEGVYVYRREGVVRSPYLAVGSDNGYCHRNWQALKYNFCSILHSGSTPHPRSSAAAPSSQSHPPFPPTSPLLEPGRESRMTVATIRSDSAAPGTGVFTGGGRAGKVDCPHARKNTLFTFLL